MRKVVLFAVLVLVASFPGSLAWAGPPEAPVARELLAVARELRLAMYYAALSVYAPTPQDQRLYAERVVRLVSGTPPEETAGEREGAISQRGILERVEAWGKAILPELPEERRRVVAIVLTNVRLFLGFALDEAAPVAKGKLGLVDAAERMRRAFAFLHAAWGADVETPYMGGIWFLLRHALSPGPRGP